MNKADKTSSRVDKLTDLLAGKTSMLIVMQDNPDPDSIASAVAMRRFANATSKVACTIGHGGTVGRGENRALVRYLDARLRPMEKLDAGKFDLSAIVDTQPGTGNNSFAPGAIPDIVIDHHPLKRATKSAQLIDIRRSYGATSTILLEYLLEAGIEPHVQLCTALLYGILSDTQTLGRETCKADIEAVTYLFPRANKRMLGEIQRGSVERSYFSMLAMGLENARVYGNYVIAGLGAIENPDMTGELADLLLRDEQIDCSICYCFFGEKMILSVRTSSPEMKADEIIHHIVARRGTGGGHQAFAGGQIPLTGKSGADLVKIEETIVRKSLRVLNKSRTAGQSLI